MAHHVRYEAGGLMGHIRKWSKDRWQARYFDPSGRERARSFRREADARRFLQTVEHEKHTGDWVDPDLSKTRFEEYARRWLETKVNVRPRTVINIEGRLRNHIFPAFGERRIDGLQPLDVRLWVKDLTEKGLSGSTVRATYQILDQVLRTAVIDRYISRSPCVGIPLPSLGSREEMHFLDPQQVRRLADAIDPRFSCLIYTAAYMGMRAGELWALKLERVNLLHGSLDVVESLSEVRGRLEVGPTKSGKARSLLIPQFLVGMLQEQMQRFPSTDGYVFTSPEGGAVRHRNFYQRFFVPSVQAAGLAPDLRFHDLRHTCAAILIANGKHIEEVKAYLGHSSIRVTSDRYGHLFPKARLALRDSLDATFQLSMTRGLSLSERPVELRRRSPDDDQPADSRAGKDTGREPGSPERSGSRGRRVAGLRYKSGERPSEVATSDFFTASS